MVAVYKTSIASEEEAAGLHRALQEHYPASQVDFDLEDCDRVLRIEYRYFDSADVIRIAAARGIRCEVFVVAKF